jgi:hypothetical protein
MKAILIDVYNEVVRQVEVDKKNVLRDWYKYTQCSMVEPVYINEHDSIMVDEEGLLTLTKDSKFFSYKGDMYAGNGLVVGVNVRNGESVDPMITVEEIRAYVDFHTIEEVRKMSS